MCARKLAASLWLGSELALKPAEGRRHALKSARKKENGVAYALL